MAYFECLPTRLNPLAERTRFYQAATGQPLSKVGAALGGVLPNIISKPLGLEVADADFDAQMAEVERVLRLGPAGDAASQSSEPEPKPEPDPEPGPARRCGSCAGPPDLPAREGARP